MPKIKSLRSKAATSVAHAKAPKSSLKIQQEEVGSHLGELDGSISKKEKRTLKREAFQTHIAQVTEVSTLSKSSQRRIKRREQEKLVADLSDMEAALQVVEQSNPAEVTERSGRSQIRDHNTTTRIAETTRTKPPTKHQRKRALEREQLRLPLIISHPEFLANPFATLRTHTQNVLARIDEE